MLGAVATEIERKFVVDEPPPEDVLGPGVRLRQGYLAEDGDVQVRVRIAGAGATLTVKAGRGLSRTEVEVTIDIVAAEALWPLTEGRRIEKVRHRVRVGGSVADVDVYDGALSGLCTAEVEFASEEEARRFSPPAWCTRDVTGTPGWDNAALARHGRPS
jgi:adenylate cyclase